MSIKVTLLLILSLACVFSISVDMTIDGQSTSKYVVSSWGDISTDGDEITIPYNNRGYIADKDSVESDSFYQSKMLGSSISFDVDYSDMECSCNGAFYLISMPALSSNGEPDATYCNDYYCDANSVCGVFCPEMDILEGNKYALSMAAHTCDAPESNGYISNCDGWGCDAHMWDSDSEAYGPGKRIDSNSKFNFKLEFLTDSDGDMNEVKATISQDGNSATFSLYSSSCSYDSYLKWMGVSVGDGMTIAMSSWGGSWNDMKWLDEDTGCTGDCTNSPSVHFSNLIIGGGETETGIYDDTETETEKEDTEAEVDEDEYCWGDACSTSSDGLCGDSCESCLYSWPCDDDDLWNSSDAACRCYEYSDDSSTSSSGTSSSGSSSGSKPNKRLFLNKRTSKSH